MHRSARSAVLIFLPMPFARPVMPGVRRRIAQAQDLAYNEEVWRGNMEEIKRTYIIDEQNRKLAVQIDIDTFNKIEELLENYALVQLMEEPADDEALELDEALAYYHTLEKVD